MKLETNIKYNIPMEENRKVLLKELKTIEDITKYWTYYLGETVNMLTTEEARTNAGKLVKLIEEVANEINPSWIGNVFGDLKNKELLVDILEDSVGVVADGIPVTALVCLFLDNLTERKIKQKEWDEFSKLKIVIEQQKELEMAEKEMVGDNKNVEEEFEKETTEMEEDMKKDMEEEEIETKEDEEDMKKEEKKEEKSGIWKKIAVGAVVVGAVATGAYFMLKKED